MCNYYTTEKNLTIELYSFKNFLPISKRISSQLCGAIICKPSGNFTPIESTSPFESALLGQQKVDTYRTVRVAYALQLLHPVGREFHNLK
jgi:hypothetical protein